MRERIYDGPVIGDIGREIKILEGAKRLIEGHGVDEYVLDEPAMRDGGSTYTVTSKSRAGQGLYWVQGIHSV